MKKFVFKIIGAVVGAAAVLATASASFTRVVPVGVAGDVIPGAYIVVLKDAVDVDGATTDLEKKHGFTASHRYGVAIKGFSAKLSAKHVASLKQDSRVEFVSEDRVVTIADHPV